jgi:predicted transcriptional regulator
MLAHQPSPAELDAAADQAADDEAMAEYEAKGGISHEAMRAWILSWGTPHELPRPQIGD